MSEPSAESAAREFFGCASLGVDMHTSRCFAFYGLKEDKHGCEILARENTALLLRREREVREECAMVADRHGESAYRRKAGVIATAAREIAQAIRALSAPTAPVGSA